MPMGTVAHGRLDVASDADINKVKADLHRFCPVAKVVRNSGTELAEIWNITRP